jgi:hypothetical protein
MCSLYSIPFPSSHYYSGGCYTNNHHYRHGPLRKAIILVGKAQWVIRCGFPSLNISKVMSFVSLLSFCPCGQGPFLVGECVTVFLFYHSYLYIYFTRDTCCPACEREWFLYSCYSVYPTCVASFWVDVNPPLTSCLAVTVRCCVFYLSFVSTVVSFAFSSCTL